ncbi:MAG: bifunctional oligoribonuclease/PAP phosphatase NrnA [Phycisphaerae bacterium]
MTVTPVRSNASSVTRVPDAVVDMITGFRRPIVVAHVVPDADALGAMLGIARAWASADRRPVASVPPGSVSSRLAFLLDWAGVPVATEADFDAADGFVVVDTAKPGRCNVGEARKATDWISGRPVVNIDHHATNTRFGDADWVVADASSSCELAYYLIKQAGCPITPPTASLLFAGILADTVGFSLPTTSASALRAASELVDLGAAAGELGERVYRSQRPSEFDLLRIIYANTNVLADGRLAYSFATYDEIRRAGCTAADIDDQINIPRSLEGVVLAMLFTEGHRGKTRINFRSAGPVTVVELAAQFRGGGHAQAAGAVLDCPAREAVDTVVPQAVAYLQRFSV